jgi:hypothetical protein
VKGGFLAGNHDRSDLTVALMIDGLALLATPVSRSSCDRARSWSDEARRLA